MGWRLSASRPAVARQEQSEKRLGQEPDFLIVHRLDVDRDLITAVGRNATIPKALRLFSPPPSSCVSSGGLRGAPWVGSSLSA